MDGRWEQALSEQRNVMKVGARL